MWAARAEKKRAPANAPQVRGARRKGLLRPPVAGYVALGGLQERRAGGGSGVLLRCSGWRRKGGGGAEESRWAGRGCTQQWKGRGN